MLVHAVNPHGMANFRRFNENNVDLNRNAVPEESWDELLGRDPNAAGYEDFDGTVFNPRRVPTALDAYINVWFRAAYGIAANGYVTLKRAMVAGQYHNPRGIFYGGEQLQASHRLLRDFLVQNGFTKTRGKVTWVDVHTGLGPSGVDTLLMERDSEDPNIWFPDAPRPPQGFNSGGGGRRRRERQRRLFRLRPDPRTNGRAIRTALPTRLFADDIDSGVRYGKLPPSGEGLDPGERRSPLLPVGGSARELGDVGSGRLLRPYG